MALLKGSNLGTEQNFNFIKQSTEELFEDYGYIKTISDVVTNTGAKINEIMYGAGVHIVNNYKDKNTKNNKMSRKTSKPILGGKLEYVGEPSEGRTSLQPMKDYKPGVKKIVSDNPLISGISSEDIKDFKALAEQSKELDRDAKTLQATAAATRRRLAEDIKRLKPSSKSSSKSSSKTSSKTFDKSKAKALDKSKAKALVKGSEEAKAWGRGMMEAKLAKRNKNDI
jgi:hypothetical protein